MSYAIELSPSAVEDLKRIESQHPGSSLFIENQLRLLAQYPSALSEPSYFPFLPNHQLYQFDKDFEPGRRSFFRILFKFSSDESRLLVNAIACQTADWWGGKD